MLFNLFCGGVWNQYDGAVFCDPSWFESFMNLFPFWKSMDPDEGRRVAALEMLPRWEGFTLDGRGETMSAWEAIGKVRDVRHCMKNSYAEKNGQFWLRKTACNFDFKEVRNVYLLKI